MRLLKTVSKVQISGLEFNFRTFVCVYVTRMYVLVFENSNIGVNLENKWINRVEIWYTSEVATPVCSSVDFFQNLSVVQILWNF